LERLRVLVHQIPNDFQRCPEHTCIVQRTHSNIVGHLERLGVLLHEIPNDV
jgi:hypothetical protein